MKPRKWPYNVTGAVMMVIGLLTVASGAVAINVAPRLFVGHVQTFEASAPAVGLSYMMLNEQPKSEERQIAETERLMRALEKDVAEWRNRPAGSR